MDETPAEQPPLPPETPASAAEPPDEVAAADRLFGGFALGIMALLLLCVVLVLIASQRMPAGL